jgi:hypothetical protein
MSGGLTEAQGAIFAALTAAGIVGGRITDNVQPNTEFPHVEIGETIAEQMAVTGRDGTDEIMILNVWSRTGSGKEVKTIVGQIREALDGKSFNASGRSSMYAWVIDENIRREPDGITRRGLIRVRVAHFGLS